MDLPSFIISSTIDYAALRKELNEIKDFDQQLDLIRSKLLLSEAEINARHQLAKMIENVIQQSSDFKDAKITIVGSSAHPLGFIDSQLDLNLEWKTDPTYNHYVATDALHRIVEILLVNTTCNEVYVPEEHLFPHEIPVIIMKWPMENTVICNLTAKAGYTIEHAKLISYFSKIEPMFKDLAILTLLWMKHSNVIHTFRLNSLSAVLMVVFYMQKKQLLPPVFGLQTIPSSKQIPRYEFAENPSWSSKLSVKPSIGELFIDFFIFYGQFDFNFIISTNFGVDLNKIYYSPGDAQFTRDYFIVQDPFKLIYATNKKMQDGFAKELVGVFADLSKVASMFKSSCTVQLAPVQLLLQIMGFKLFSDFTKQVGTDSE